MTQTSMPRLLRRGAVVLSLFTCTALGCATPAEPPPGAGPTGPGGAGGADGQGGAGGSASLCGIDCATIVGAPQALPVTLETAVKHLPRHETFSGEGRQDHSQHALDNLKHKRQKLLQRGGGDNPTMENLGQ